MDAKGTSTGTAVMEAIRAMMEQAGALPRGAMVTDCIILTRVEEIDGSGQRDRWYPMGMMDEVRVRGLLDLHHDDVVEEDRARRR